MKFNQYLTGLNRDCPVVYRDQFLKYKLLKKLLKACRPECDQQGAVCTDCEARFFDELRRQLHAANRHFAFHATKIIDGFHSQQQTPLCGCWLRPRRPRQRQLADLAQRAYWCRKYAKANAVALRKILKKHDKCCQNTTGKQFLQECWRSDVKSNVGLFLHSPLLDELKAIQDVLQAQLPAEDPDLVERAAPPALAAKQAQQAAQQQGGQTEGQESGGAARDLPQLSVKTAPVPIGAGRVSIDSQGSSWGSPPPAGSVDCGVSYTSPSLRQQRQRVLSAIVESPTCMLDTGDIEWCTGPGSPPASAGAAVMVFTRSAGQEGGGLRGAAATPEPPPLGSSELAAAMAAADGSGSGSAAGPLGAAGAPPELAGVRGFEEEELKCPICLDMMYKPVGLSCGHKFCRQCSLEAVGFGRAVGAFHNIASHVPLRATCPQCRQAGVYREAVALREVGKLIQTRYPAEWAERRAEEKARNKQLAAEYSQRQRALLHSRNAFELLFTQF